jgi:F0F1-type ATP synthase assembly protein I
MSGGDAGHILSARGLLPQAAVGALVAIVAIASGRYAAWSALGGAAVAWVTTLYMWSRSRVLEQSVAAALRRAMVGELVKVVGTIALFAAAARVPHLVWAALLLGYAAALVACWVSSVAYARAQARMGWTRVTSELGS